jgi:hypothetical protein
VLVGKLANIGLFIASCLLVHAIGEHTELALGGKGALVYPGLSPNQIAYSNLFASEPLSLFLP